METTNTTPAEASATPTKSAKVELTAKEKCQAILSVWTERTSISAICRKYSMQRPQVERWEALALEGMLRALEVRPRGLHAADAPQTGLSSRLEKLLERKFNPPPKAPKMKSVLEGKLEQAEKKVQRGRPPKTAVHGE